MSATVVVWLLLSISSPEKIELSSTHATREACNVEQINKHFSRPKVEHRCVPIRVFVSATKAVQK